MCVSSLVRSSVSYVFSGVTYVSFIHTSYLSERSERVNLPVNWRNCETEIQLSVMGVPAQAAHMSHYIRLLRPCDSRLLFSGKVRTLRGLRRQKKCGKHTSVITGAAGTEYKIITRGNFCTVDSLRQCRRRLDDAKHVQVRLYLYLATSVCLQTDFLLETLVL